MYPPSWGSDLWKCLHIIAYTYPENPPLIRQDSMNELLSGVSMNLPCPGCSIHAVEYITSNPPNVKSREGLKKWMCDFHNSVNVRLGKRSLTYEESDTLIESQYTMKDMLELHRSEQKRMEDHKKISELLEKISELERERTSPKTHSQEEGDARGSEGIADRKEKKKKEGEESDEGDEGGEGDEGDEGKVKWHHHTMAYRILFFGTLFLFLGLYNIWNVKRKRKNE